MEKTAIPIYVKLDEYKDVLDIIAMIKTKTNEAKVLLQKINEIKEGEESNLQQWYNELEEIDRTIELVDKVLFEPEQN